MKCVPISKIIQYPSDEDVGFTKCNREFNPARNKHSIEMPMCNNKDVADTDTFLQVFPVGFADLHIHDDGYIMLVL